MPTVRGAAWLAPSHVARGQQQIALRLSVPLFFPLFSRAPLRFDGLKTGLAASGAHLRSALSASSQDSALRVHLLSLAGILPGSPNNALRIRLEASPARLLGAPGETGKEKENRRRHVQQSRNITGFLGRDAETRTGRNGYNFTTFSVATKRSWKNRETGEYESQTTWHRCIAFGPHASFAGSLLKGNHVQIEGELQTRDYEEKPKGKKSAPVTKTATEIRVARIVKLESRRQLRHTKGCRIGGPLSRGDANHEYRIGEKTERRGAQPADCRTRTRPQRNAATVSADDVPVPQIFLAELTADLNTISGRHACRRLSFLAEAGPIRQKGREGNCDSRPDGRPQTKLR